MSFKEQNTEQMEQNTVPATKKRRLYRGFSTFRTLFVFKSVFETEEFGLWRRSNTTHIRFFDSIDVTEKKTLDEI